MFNKIIYVGVTALAVIVGFVLANPHGGHPGLSLPSIPIPTVRINTGGLLALLRNPPLPIVELPPFQVPNLPFPVLSLPDIHGGGHGGLDLNSILSGILGGGHSAW